MIYDTFLFFNELDLLEIRLRTLAGVVDKFMILESSVTHKGDSKPCYYLDNRERFSQWSDQIIYLGFEDLPKDPSPDVEGDPNDGAWLRVRAQREAMMRAVPFEDNDTVIISDLDEIAQPEVVAGFNAKETLVAGLQLQDYIYYLNLKGECAHVEANIMSGRYARGADHLALRGDNGKQPRPIIQNAGWHFSYMGGGAVAAAKTATGAHWNSEDVKEMVKAFSISTEEQIKRHGGIDGVHLTKVPIDASYPMWIQENVPLLAERGLIHLPLL